MGYHAWEKGSVALSKFETIAYSAGKLLMSKAPHAMLIQAPTKMPIGHMATVAMVIVTWGWGMTR